jgi:hypothetical protein
MKVVEIKWREREQFAMPKRHILYELTIFQTLTAIMNSVDLSDSRFSEQNRSTDRSSRFESAYDAVMPREDV